MHRYIGFALLLTLPAAVPAAERKLFISSFERVRVEGPYQVTVAAGRSPGGTISGEAAQLDGVEVRQDGMTLVVRPSIARWEEQPHTLATKPVAIGLATPSLSGVSVIGASKVSATGMKGKRIDLSVAGTGAIDAAVASADEVNATTVGNGQITASGRTAKARLIVNGAGVIHADALDAGEVLVRVDGPGEATGRARFTANVANTGLGRVAITGSPKCTVLATAGGPVACGAAPLK